MLAPKSEVSISQFSPEFEAEAVRLVETKHVCGICRQTNRRRNGVGDQRRIFSVALAPHTPHLASAATHSYALAEVGFPVRYRGYVGYEQSGRLLSPAVTVTDMPGAVSFSTQSNRRPSWS